MTEELLLTDDEVVALAGDRGGRWPLPLPTVDLTRERQWREAAWRGRRSLAVRRLVGVGATGDAMLERVRRDVVDARGALALRLGAAGASAFEVNAFAATADDDLVVETVSDQGVHGFGRLGHDALVERLTGLAEQAHGRGVAGRTGTATLRIGIVGAGRQPSLRVGAGRAEVVEVEDDRVVVGVPPRPVPDLAAEVARLADAIRRAPGLVTVAGRS